MAFLDNSGDIILDAVLTDAGRQRLARGKFKITKFALGDEEINYELYNSQHPSSSAFYDLEIMQTPILEAFTNNTSLMKSKLITINRNNILYMPTFKLNAGGGVDGIVGSNRFTKTAVDIGFNGFILLADENTRIAGASNTDAAPAGVFFGDDERYDTNGTTHIAVDTGIDGDGTASGLSLLDEMPADLMETAFLVKVDDRLMTLNNFTREGIFPVIDPQFVDDDAIATYYFGPGPGSTFTIYGPRQTGFGRFRDRLTNRDVTDSKLNEVKEKEVFSGPIGPMLALRPKAAKSIRYSSSLFNQFGTAGDSNSQFTYKGNSSFGGAGYRFIDTSINVVGITTGQSIDIPIRIIKKT
tara:strand:+ start:317 stop:1381 length:1065 start_codon:yes stop_codon:yes gene_type:complete